MKKLTLILGLLLLIPTIAQAQTVSQTLEYDYKVTTPAVVSGWTQAIKINTGAFTTFTPTCAAIGADTHCTFPLPAPGVKSGDVITVSATNAAGSASGSLTYNPGSIPTTPSSVTITVIIKVP